MASSFAVKMGKAFLLGWAESLGTGLGERALKRQEKREKQDSSWVSEFLRGVVYGIPKGQDFAKQARKDLGDNCQAPKKCKFSPEDVERFELTQTVELLARSAPMTVNSPDQWAAEVVAHALALRTELHRVLDARKPNAVDPSAVS